MGNYNKHSYLNHLMEMSGTADSTQGQAALCTASLHSADTSLPINVTEAGLEQASQPDSQPACTMQTDC